MAAFTQVADEEIQGIGQLGAGNGERGIEVDGMAAEIEGVPGKTRPVRYLTLYMTAPPYKAISVKETMVPTTLRKTHRDKARPELLNKPVFSRTPVHEEERGTHMCPLFPGSPKFTEMRAMGVTEVCTGGSFLNEFEVENHVRLKHKRPYLLMQNMKSEGERAETKGIQQATLEALQAQSAALLALAQGGGIQAPVAQPAAAPAVVQERVVPAQMKCADCDYLTPEGHGAPQFPLGKHRKEAHPID